MCSCPRPLGAGGTRTGRVLRGQLTAGQPRCQRAASHSEWRRRSCPVGKNTDNLADKPSSIILTKNASIISVPLLTNLYVLPTDTFRGKKKGYCLWLSTATQYTLSIDVIRARIAASVGLGGGMLLPASLDSESCVLYLLSQFFCQTFDNFFFSPDKSVIYQP